MEPKFTAKTVYTYELYKDFSLTLGKKHHHSIIGYITFAIFFFASGFVVITKEEMNAFIFVVLLISDALFLLLFMLLLRALTIRQIKKTWNSDKLAQNSTVSFAFYDDAFEAVDANGNTRIKYSDIFAVYETKKAVYIMISNIQGMLINKADCSDELVQFLLNIKAK